MHIHTHTHTHIYIYTHTNMFIPLYVYIHIKQHFLTKTYWATIILRYVYRTSLDVLGPSLAVPVVDVAELLLLV